jgi:hypothetical protein
MLRKPLAQIYNNMIGSHKLYANLTPAFQNLVNDPHQAIPTIASCIREYWIDSDTLPIITGALQFIAANHGVLRDAQTYHSFGVLVLSSTYHTHKRFRQFQKQRIQIEDVSRYRMTNVLIKYFSHNNEAFNVEYRLNNLNEAPRIPLLTDQHWASDYFGYRDVCRENAEVNLGSMEVFYLHQLGFQMADLARFHSTLSYPHMTEWYNSEKQEIGQMWRKIIIDPSVADKITQDSFNQAEIGCSDEERVRKSQEKALSDPTFQAQIMAIAEDIEAFHKFSWRFSAPGRLPSLKELSR